MHEYRDHRDVLIGDCDCTGACKALCQEKGVCDESQKTLIETLQAMPAADLDAEISKSKNEIAAVESQFKADVDKLHAKYKSLEDDKKDAIAQVKSAGLGLMKSIREEKKKTHQASVSEL
jgi:flagellar motility protein MotE (MotC chaperone)